MNRERIQQLRDFIASLPPERVDMRDYFNGHRDFTPGEVVQHYQPKKLTHGCGTSACIAGWALTLFRPDSLVPVTDVDLEVSTVLGLTFEVAYELCYPPHFQDPGRYTQADAVAALDSLLETGEVRWPGL